MAHFAKVNENNIVEEVCVVSNTDSVSGQAFLNSIGLTGIWLQTSYNTYANKHKLGGVPLRGNYAAVGYKYDPKNDVFIPPQPYPSWSISIETNWEWTSPVPCPKYGMYNWSEDEKKWVKIPTIVPGIN